ncbi:MAG: threonine synthase [Flavisolibacter sp.]
MKKPGPSLASVLYCPLCGKDYSLHSIQHFATCCNQPLLVRYLIKTPLPDIFVGRESGMWRYFEMLPLADFNHIISLGEGMTPIVSLKRLASQYGFDQLLMKDESQNPTGSFKSRGISVALSKAMELGIKRFIMPSAGNAGSALAAYSAHAGAECVVVMPRMSSRIFKEECRLYGAKLIEVDGLIDDCAKTMMEINRDNHYFDLSTMKEPYRIEGKKTMGYEIFEQLDGVLPDYIVYPTGGGTGLIGIWKAFQEMKEMGWIKGKLPCMISVQSQSCASVEAAMHHPENWKENFHAKPSIAEGLVVPQPFGMDLIQKVLKESEGTVISLPENSIREAVKELARAEGVLISPEGAAAWQGLKELRQKKLIRENATVLFLNTASAHKYPEVLSLAR